MTLNKINYTSPTERTSDGHDRGMVQTLQKIGRCEREKASVFQSSVASCVISHYLAGVECVN